MNIDNLLSNKKLLLLIGLALLILLVVSIVIILPHHSPATEITDDYIDDSKYIQYVDNIDTYIATQHPINQILPVRNQSPFYYISLYIDGEDSNSFSASLEISYYTEEGKAAAEVRLKSSDFAKYHPENYNIIYTQLTDN